MGLCTTCSNRKKVWGPAGLVAAIAFGGAAIGSAGTLLVQKLKKEISPEVESSDSESDE